MIKTTSRLRRCLVAGAVAAGLVLVPFGVGAKPASAMTCDESIQPACYVVAKVVCGVVAKGRPCLA